MELHKSYESIRDIICDAWVAGKLLCAQAIERIDHKWADRLNNPNDDYPLED